RDFHVTGVQTCALPILGVGGYVNTHRWNGSSWNHVGGPRSIAGDGTFQMWFGDAPGTTWTLEFVPADGIPYMTTFLGVGDSRPRSEERRVGKEGRTMWR